MDLPSAQNNVLNNRQSYMPLAVVIMNGLMGMMVVIAYLIDRQILRPDPLPWH